MDKYYASPKQDEIMEFLFKARGANVDQITRALNSISSSVEFIEDTLIRNTYGILKKLERYGLVEFTNYKLDIKDRERRLYQLSKKGLMEFYQKRKVNENTIALGYFGEFGFIKHSLYTPPKRYISHHLMTVDAMVDVYSLWKINQGRIDFANNLFVAQKQIKPDFGIEVKGGSNYLVEIDCSNERGKKIHQKFAVYADYFVKLKKEGKQLPSAIFFVVPNYGKKNTSGFRSKKLRYQSITNVFVKECAEFLEEVNLYFVESQTFISTLVKEINQFSKTKLQEYYKHLLEEGLILSSLDNCILQFESEERKKIIGIYTVIEGMQTKPWIVLEKVIEEVSKFNSKGAVLSFIENENINILVYSEKPVVPDFISKYINLQFIDKKNNALSQV